KRDGSGHGVGAFTFQICEAMLSAMLQTSGMLKAKKLAVTFARTALLTRAAFVCTLSVCFLFACALLLCALPGAAQVAEATNPSSGVPTPQSVLGHKPGDDFYLANYDESREYFHKLAASSNRIKLINVGKTTRGLDWEIAIISSPENLASLDKY